jgi:hypothetical protein
MELENYIRVKEGLLCVFQGYRRCVIDDAFLWGMAVCRWRFSEVSKVKYYLLGRCTPSNVALNPRRL